MDGSIINLLSDGSLLEKRQQQAVLAIPTSYLGLNSGPAPAIVVAIVLGSVVGFLLVFWLFLTCLSFGGRPSFSWPWSRGKTEEEVVVVRRDSDTSPSSPSASPTSPTPHARRRPLRERESEFVEERVRVDRLSGGRPLRPRTRDVPRGPPGQVRFLFVQIERL